MILDNGRNYRPRNVILLLLYHFHQSWQIHRTDQEHRPAIKKTVIYWVVSSLAHREFSIPPIVFLLLLKFQKLFSTMYIKRQYSFFLLPILSSSPPSPFSSSFFLFLPLPSFVFPRLRSLALIKRKRKIFPNTFEKSAGNYVCRYVNGDLKEMVFIIGFLSLSLSLSIFSKASIQKRRRRRETDQMENRSWWNLSSSFFLASEGGDRLIASLV